jgi:hypothetical protein
MAMHNLTLASEDTSVPTFSEWLNSLVGELHPDYPDRIIVGIVSVHFLALPYWEEYSPHPFQRIEACAIVATDAAVATG